MRMAIANNRRAKKLLRASEAQTQRLIDLGAVELPCSAVLRAEITSTYS